jgi:hypothetical protein
MDNVSSYSLTAPFINTLSVVRVTRELADAGLLSHEVVKRKIVPYMG